MTKKKTTKKKTAKRGQRTTSAFQTEFLKTVVAPKMVATILVHQPKSISQLTKLFNKDHSSDLSVTTVRSHLRHLGIGVEQKTQFTIPEELSAKHAMGIHDVDHLYPREEEVPETETERRQSKTAEAALRAFEEEDANPLGNPYETHQKVNK